jgi:hypothetical protein
VSFVRKEPFWCLAELHDQDAIVRKGVVESLQYGVIAIESLGERNFRLWVTAERVKHITSK